MALKMYEILEAFPEEIETIVPRLIKELEKKERYWENYFISLEKQKYKKETKSFIKDVMKYIYMPVQDLNNLNRLRRLYSLYKNKGKEKKTVEERDIELAKTVPIESVYDFGKTVVRRKTISAKCPFHPEKNPSFVIYKEKNTCYCFSCKFFADSIEFVRKIYNLDFVEAIKYLNKRV